MTTSTDRSQLPAHLRGFVLAHDAMRRDASRFATAAEHLTTTEQASRLQRWHTRFERLIEHHHHREDDLLWPELRRRVPDFAPHEEALSRDHRDLDTALAAVADALRHTADHVDADTRSDLVSATQALRDLLVDHLAREEDVALPRIADGIPPEGWASLERQMAKGTSLGMLAFELPWAFEGVPRHVEQQILAALPTPLRILNRVAFKPSYRRLAAALEIAR